MEEKKNNLFSTIKVRGNDFILKYGFKAQEDVKSTMLSTEEIEKAIEDKLNTSKYLYIDIQKELINEHRFYVRIHKEDKKYTVYGLFRRLEGDNKHTIDKNFIKIEDANKYGIYMKIEIISELLI